MKNKLGSFKDFVIKFKCNKKRRHEDFNATTDRYKYTIIHLIPKLLNFQVLAPSLHMQWIGASLDFRVTL